MDTSLGSQAHRSLAQFSVALTEPQELSDFYPGDERNYQRTTDVGHTDGSPARAVGAVAVGA